MQKAPGSCAFAEWLGRDTDDAVVSHPLVQKTRQVIDASWIWIEHSSEACAPAAGQIAFILVQWEFRAL